MPVALLAGTIGRSAGRRVTELLATAFGPRALRLLPGVGHMAPATHPDVVNPYILAHLAANPIAARR